MFVSQWGKKSPPKKNPLNFSEIQRNFRLFFFITAFESYYRGGDNGPIHIVQIDEFQKTPLCGPDEPSFPEDFRRRGSESKESQDPLKDFPSIAICTLYSRSRRMRWSSSRPTWTLSFFPSFSRTSSFFAVLVQSRRRHESKMKVLCLGCRLRSAKSSFDLAYSHSDSTFHAEDHS